MKFYGALETGGTKFVAAVGRPNEPPVRETRIPTTNPEETLRRVAGFFRECAADGLGIASLGIASFGPVKLDTESPRWGFITSTPKPGWRDTDLAGALGRSLGVPVGFDTDVNAAALAEARLGAGRGLDPVVYITVGTGIGGGAVVNGKVLHGALHPEMGHIPVQRRADDAYPGSCPFHGSCWEGLASGPAIQARWGIPGEDLPPDHPAWDLEAWYLAQGIVSILMILSPRVILLGGGVGRAPGLLNRTRTCADKICAGYPGNTKGLESWERMLCAPELDSPGLAGAFLLAESANSL